MISFRNECRNRKHSSKPRKRLNQQLQLFWASPELNTVLCDKGNLKKKKKVEAFTHKNCLSFKNEDKILCKSIHLIFKVYNSKYWIFHISCP